MSKDNDSIFIVDFGISKVYCTNGEHMYYIKITKAIPK
jgi:casein kinase 1